MATHRDPAHNVDVREDCTCSECRRASGTLYIEARFPVTRQALRDILTTAIEGGSNYWATFSKAERNEDLDYLAVMVSCEDGTGKRINVRVKPEDLTLGLQRLIQRPGANMWDNGAAFQHFADAIGDQENSTGDATTADVVLQMTVLGDVVYG